MLFLYAFCLLVSVLGGVGVGGMAKDLGRNQAAWFVFGFTCPLIALVAIELVTPVATRRSR